MRTDLFSTDNMNNKRHSDHGNEMIASNKRLRTARLSCSTEGFSPTSIPGSIKRTDSALPNIRARRRASPDSKVTRRSVSAVDKLPKNLEREDQIALRGMLEGYHLALKDDEDHSHRVRKTSSVFRRESLPGTPEYDALESSMEVATQLLRSRKLGPVLRAILQYCKQLTAVVAQRFIVLFIMHLLKRLYKSRIEAFVMR